MTIQIPDLSLVVLIGTSGAGKSTFARKHFLPTEVISSDYCRALVSDDENSLAATGDAFDVLHYIASKRLAAGKLTVVDATNVQPEARKPLIDLARAHHCLPVAIVLDMPERICQERNKLRPDRNFGPHVIRKQRQQLNRSFRGLEREGFRRVIVMKTEEEIASATIERQPLWTNRRGEHGPFDIIGDVHGCCDELEALLEKLGYHFDETDGAALYNRVYSHPEGRTAVFLGDIVDRGPRIVDCCLLVLQMMRAGHAICVPGNHDVKLLKKLRGRNVRVKHGLEQTVNEIAALSDDVRPGIESQLVEWIDSLVSHFVLDDGKLVVAHAGMKENMQGRASSAVRDFALYGETTGETDEFGLPVRYNWAADYRGQAMVVYGHTPVPEPTWLNRTINIDTGCVFGGRLTALRYPEREVVSVTASRVYSEPVRPLEPQPQSQLSQQHEHDSLLDLSDVSGKRIIDTRLLGTVMVREQNATAALEVMSRFAVDPRWLIYLPPTMSPTATSMQPDLLEHPGEAFDYFRSQGIAEVVCEEKHMGSRAVVVVCRDETVAPNRFGIIGGGPGVVYTRTGRPFFEDRTIERAMLERLQHALEASGFWEAHHTNWVCLDCELMPWSAKAQELLRGQYAAVGAAARIGLSESITAVEQASQRGLDMSAMLTSLTERLQMAEGLVHAYRRYCWNVTSIDDLRLAPFHILASEGTVHIETTHRYQMEAIKRIVEAQVGSMLQATNFMVIQTSNEASVKEGIAWWSALTERGGEGMVVKPMDFIVRNEHGLAQPAVKCRGREYLRIIYGPEYTTPEHLKQLRQRSLGLKRSLAMREFALGIEALERFVRREPLRRVHECVFGVLAMESEPVDPRL